MAKEFEFFKDIVKGEEVEVKALYDKNGKELYNGAKAMLDVPWGDGFEIGKIVVQKGYDYIDDKYGRYFLYEYAFKPKKGSALWIEPNGSNVELI